MEVTVANNIIEQIQEGNEQAYEQLFRTYYAHLCNYAHQFLHEKAGSEEVVQDVFFKLWEKRTELQIQTNIKSYLFSAVRNQCLNVIKHLDIRDTYKTFNEHHISLSEQEDADQVVVNELSDKIEAVIQALPEERQKVFRLSRFEGKKYKEIADELGISVKTVEAQMSKALKFMREQLKDYLPVILLFLGINFLDDASTRKWEEKSSELTKPPTSIFQLSKNILTSDKGKSGDNCHIDSRSE